MQVILTILLSALCVQLGQTEDLSLQESYDKINRHLSKKISSEDVDKNMNEAEKWLGKIQQGGSSCFAFERDTDCILINALESFLKLKELVSSCDDSGRTIVRVNDEAARMSQDKYAKHPVRRIEKIVHHYVKQHYEMCHSDSFTQKFEKLSKKNLLYISSMGHAIPSANLSRLAVDCIEIVRINIGLTEFKNRAEMRKHHVTKEDFGKFLIQPCQELERVLDGETVDQYTPDEYNHYDLGAVEEFHLDNKRKAVNKCRAVLKLGETIYPEMVKQMKRLKEEDRLREEQEAVEAAKRAELVKRALQAEQAEQAIRAEQAAKPPTSRSSYSGPNRGAYVAIFG